MKKAVVTGGAGFIGSHVVDELVNRGYRVSVIDDLSSGRRENLDSSTELFVADISSPEARDWLKSQNPDVVVHAAAQISVRTSMENPPFDAHVNVEGLLNLLHAFGDGPFPHWVFISTGGAIYGEQDIHPAPEAHPVRPESIYGLSKRVGEIYLEFYERKFGLKWTALRLANVYGPRQNPHGEAGVVAIFAQRLLAGETPRINGTGEQTRDFVFVKDVAKAVCDVAEKSVIGIYNIGTGVETDVNELAAHIVSAVGCSTEIPHGPGLPGEQMRSSIDAGLAHRTFEWKPTVAIGDGIRMTVDWFRSQAQ
ncbi:NAD-dependent epimerase/dehydratase family protein [Kamptonema cortianum]|nr:NAD-dependent epimerase/dehydratase family protein [Geitlerinema splendidum]MDK3155343.1 NAD-dependent epimerase/dehydratase family protein [Kamptonema cortianum]